MEVLSMRLEYLPLTKAYSWRGLSLIYHLNTIYILFSVPVASFKSLCNILQVLHSAIFILLSLYESKQTSDLLQSTHCAVFVSNIGKASVSKTSANEARIASNSLQGKRVRLGEQKACDEEWRKKEGRQGCLGMAKFRGHTAWTPC